MRIAKGLWALLQLAVLLAGEALAVVGLHRLGALPFLQVGWEDPGFWLRATPPEDVLLAVCRLAALGCAYWLLGGTLLYTAVRALRIPGALRAVEWAALPAVRRVADRAVAVALATSSVVGAGAGGAWADGPISAVPPPVVVSVSSAGLSGHKVYRPVAAGVPDPGPVTSSAALHADPWSGAERAMPTPVLSTAMPTPVLPAATPTPVLPTAMPAPVPLPGQHVVVGGDDLWTIAVDRLAEAEGTAPDAVPLERVAAYWRVLVEANTATLRSGDPDLLIPGEILTLPGPEAGQV